jgi:hypothetical protein
MMNQATKTQKTATGPNKVGPNKVGPNKVGPNKVGPNKVGPNKVGPPTPTPFCKFCFGAGEPEKMYTSHWQFTRPIDGKLVCPKLLANKCANCNELGHVTQRCSAARKNPAPQKNPAHLYCRFCFNAQNPSFLDHNQFDKEGKVQCPFLLNIECQTCGVRGHTKKYCAPIVLQGVAQIEKPKATPSKNPFAMLTIPEDEVKDEDEDEVKHEVKVKVEDKDKVEVEVEPEVDVLQMTSLNKFPMLLSNKYNASTKPPPVKNVTIGGWLNTVKNIGVVPIAQPVCANAAVNDQVNDTVICVNDPVISASDVEEEKVAPSNAMCSNAMWSKSSWADY